MPTASIWISGWQQSQKTNAKPPSHIFPLFRFFFPPARLVLLLQSLLRRRNCTLGFFPPDSTLSFSINLCSVQRRGAFYMSRWNFYRPADLRPVNSLRPRVDAGGNKRPRGKSAAEFCVCRLLCDDTSSLALIRSQTSSRQKRKITRTRPTFQPDRHYRAHSQHLL